MPTARGWMLVGAGAALVATGRLLGALQVERLGLALIALVVIAVFVVRRSRGDVQVTRSIEPSRSSAGMPVTVRLSIANQGRAPAALMLMEDRLPRGIDGRGRFVVQGLERDGTRRASYEVTAARRGRYEIGPLTISFLDPFGIARVRTASAPAGTLLARPRVEQLTMPRDSGERRSVTSASVRSPFGASGEDFYTLRDYMEGDDLRRVHWPATARRGKYTIRQEETPWQTRATILLDDRVEAYLSGGVPAPFERAVEAAASLCDLYHRSGYAWRLSGVVGRGSPTHRGADHLARCLDWLTTAELAEAGSGDRLEVALHEAGNQVRAESALVLITGTLDPKQAPMLGLLRRRYRDVVLISLPDHLYGRHSTKARWAGGLKMMDHVRMLDRSGVRTILLGPGDPLASAWAPTRSGAGPARVARPQVVR